MSSVRTKALEHFAKHQDVRMSVASLERALKCSASSVRRVMTQLEEEGLVKGEYGRTIYLGDGVFWWWITKKDRKKKAKREAKKDRLELLVQELRTRLSRRGIQTSDFWDDRISITDEESLEELLRFCIKGG